MRPEQLFQFSDEWRYERFVTTIEQLASVTWPEAERAARATMEVLGERLSGDEARALAGELPGELRMWLLSGGEHAQRFDVSEFMQRVADRADVDPETGDKQARTVLLALGRLVRRDEMAKLAAELPREYRDTLLAHATRQRRDPAASAVVLGDVFIDRVARRAGLSPAEARRASEAVIETLAERIAGGEVDDLAEQLPEDLHPALERGKSATRGKAQRMSLDEFVERIADREQLGYEQALAHARAVFAALRDTLSDKKFSDMLAELPRGYQEALL